MQKIINLKSQVVIFGAGIAGLACAMTLKKNNISYLILENQDYIGGRIKTNSTPDGFLLDQGFQVLLTSYPELKYFLDLKKLNLKKFNSGAFIQVADSSYIIANPIKHPDKIFSTLKCPFISFKDQLLVIKLIFKAYFSNDFESLENKTTLEFLTDFGFSSKMIENFWTPFMSGIYLDPQLTLDAGYFLFLIKCFGLGQVTVPENGMAEIPLQMSAELDPNSILLLQKNIKTNEKQIILENGQIINTSFIVKAYNSDKKMRSASTYYFSTEKKISWSKWLVLVPKKLGYNTNHIAIMSEISKKYTANNQQLISATVLGSDNIDADIIKIEIEKMSCQNLNLKHLKTDHVVSALPELKFNPNHFIKNNFNYECGDHVSSPSIQGALKSGRLAALDIISCITQ